MRPVAALLPALAVAIVLALAPAAVRAQGAMSWWLGGPGGGGGTQAPPVQGPIGWWLGAGGDPAEAPAAQATQSVAWWLGSPRAGGAGGGPVNAAQSVGWWLGTGGAGTTTGLPAEPVRPDQTLRWWLGTQAEAETGSATAIGQGAEGEAPNYSTWNELARLAEQLIEDPRTTNLALEQLRSQLSEWRERLLAAQSANRARIDTLRNQIAALGPAPAEGEVEAPEIAQRRSELNEQLALLQAPGIAAEEAYRRADGLIREIDSILRARQTSELLELAPSPLVPRNWAAAAAVLADLGRSLAAEAREGWARPEVRAAARQNLPATILLLALGGTLIWRGRHWSETLAGRFLKSGGRRAKRAVLAFLVSLGQVVLPYAGVVLLVTAIFSTGLVGIRGGAILSVLPVLGFVILAARWLGRQVFAEAEEATLLPGLAPERRAEGRFYATLLGVLLGVQGLLAATVPYEGATQAARVVLSFPLFLSGGLILVRLGQILIRAARAASEGGEPSTRARLMLLIGRAVIVLGLLGPLLAVAGYHTAARFLTFPAALSLALFAFLAILQRLVADLYALLTGRGEDEEEALVPVLVGFALTLAALPVLALIWGARTSDLTELWTRAREGFTFGQTRIAPADFVTFAVVFALGYLITRLIQGALKTSVLPKTRLDPGGQNAVVSGVGYLGIVLSAIVAITSAGIDLSSLAIVAGALSVGIGFGLQNIVSNFVSGVILLIERPVSEGDWIEVNGRQGYVRDISVRSTRIETFDRTDVIVPNSDLISGVVTNYTRGNLTGRIILKVQVAYGSDTRKVERVLREVAEAHPLVTLSPKPLVLFMGFGADGLEFEIRAILRDVNFSLSTRSEMNHEIARRFAEEGIEIPFAQRDLWLRNPEALAAAVAGAGLGGAAAAAPASPPEPAPPPEGPPDPRLHHPEDIDLPEPQP